MSTEEAAIPRSWRAPFDQEWAEREATVDRRASAVANAALRVERIASLDALRALEPEWRALYAASGNALPFVTFDWVDCWWAYLSTDTLAVRDRMEVHVVRNASAEVVAIAPFVTTERPGRGPLRARELQLIGADPAITELRGLLVHPANESDAVDALRRHFCQHAGEWDWISWSGLRAGSDAEAALAASGCVRWTREIRSYVLPLAPTWEQFRAGLKRNIRESLRHCYNSLARDGHEFRCEVAQSADDVDGALSAFFELHGRRANLKDTVAHENVFASNVSRQFLRATCARLAHHGVIRVFSLVVAEKVVAVRIGFVLGDSLYLYYSGYDPEWRSYSVMTTVVAEALKYAIANGIRSANLSTGADLSKTRWGPAEVRYRDAVQMSPRLRSRLVHRIYDQAVNSRSSRVGVLARSWLGRRWR